jgi:hypothetical protein
MMLQKLEYMHVNPVKRGYVDDPLHWRYSSARNYAGCKDWWMLSRTGCEATKRSFEDGRSQTGVWERGEKQK